MNQKEKQAEREKVKKLFLTTAETQLYVSVEELLQRGEAEIVVEKLPVPLLMGYLTSLKHEFPQLEEIEVIAPEIQLDKQHSLVYIQSQLILAIVISEGNLAEN